MKYTNMQLKSLFLQQSYLDAWDGYERSLHGDPYICWDYVILTASNSKQAKSYQYEVDERLKNGYLPGCTRYLVTTDPEGKRVGSGGATLNVLKEIRERENSFKGLRILTIHSGGDSRRVPQYSACGKLFSPVPHELPDGRASTLFDELIIGMSGVPSRITDGMLVLSGDVLLLFNPLQIDGQIDEAAAVSIKESVQTGRDHGVFLKDREDYVSRFLHKQDEAVLRGAGAVNEHGNVDLDTGAILLGVRVLDGLYGLICENGVFSEAAFQRFVNEKTKISFYGDFLYPLAKESTFEQFLLEDADGEMSAELLSCRKVIWDRISGFSLKLISLSPAQFIHFGTTRELLRLFTEQLPDYKNLGWKQKVNSAEESIKCGAGYSLFHAYIGRNAVVQRGAYIENSFVAGTSEIGTGSVISGLKLEDVSMPAQVVCHGLRLTGNRFVIRLYGTDDNPKDTLDDGFYMNMSLKDFLQDNGLTEETLWDEDEPHNLWTARLYTICQKEEAAWEWTRILLDMVNGTAKEPLVRKWAASERTSLRESFEQADYRAESEWKKELDNRIISRAYVNVILRGGTEEEALSVFADRGLTVGVYRELMQDAKKADFSLKLRVYHGMASYGKKNRGSFHSCSDHKLSVSELENACLGLIKEYCVDGVESVLGNADCEICEPCVNVEFPVRVNWGGGWTDTPPYCNENGGVVLNAAIKVNGIFPVRVCVRRLEEYHIEFESADVGAHGIYHELGDIQDCHNPYDPFALHKAALIVCGIVPEIAADGQELTEILQRLGGGIYLSTEVKGIPKGSGLGTSSILSAACVKAIWQFLGMSVEDAIVCGMVLRMEQIMSTGGGWQDQAGGLIAGAKLVSSRPGSQQKLQIDKLQLDKDTKIELQERFALIYTGQRRLARNLLRDIIGGYIEGRSDSIEALREMKPLAVLMKFQLEQGNVDAFAELLNQHWERSLQLDHGTTNTCIDQIFLAIEDLIDGKFICGAGGGGFLQVIMKRGVTHAMLHERLHMFFQDTGVDVWQTEFIW